MESNPSRVWIPACAWVLIFALVAASPFLPGLEGGFIFDDRVNILKNASLHLAKLTPEGLLYAAYSFQPGHGSRPLAMLSFALDFWRAGLDPAAFKTTNLALHALAALALSVFFRRAMEQLAWPRKTAMWAAIALALAWAVHPLQVSTVLYVVQRMQILGTLFLLLALLAYMGMRRAQISGDSGRIQGLLTLLLWGLAFASKEDSILLPAYTLALELTILDFRAGKSRTEMLLRRAYGLGGALATVAFLLVFMPRQWQWEVYPGRDFSSYERLLTQARVLVMYLGQAVWPLPDRMPFFYDDITVSRGLIRPPATLACLLALVLLLGSAWRWRRRRPLFALGVLLFFSGHFLSSNVLGLELAFEHRNHFPLAGAVLALGDLALLALSKARAPGIVRRASACALIGVLALLTVWRAHIWGEPERLAQYSVQLTPHSERAWLYLTSIYIQRSGMAAGNPWLRRAIDTSSQGASLTQSVPILSNIVIYKTIEGTVTQDDWQRFLARLDQAPLSPQTIGVMWVMLDGIGNGIPLDESGMLKMIDVIAPRARLASNEYLRIAAYLHNDTLEPYRALPYLKLAVLAAPPDDPGVGKMLAELPSVGRADWTAQLKQLQSQKRPGKGE